MHADIRRADTSAQAHHGSDPGKTRFRHACTPFIRRTRHIDARHDAADLRSGRQGRKHDIGNLLITVFPAQRLHQAGQGHIFSPYAAKSLPAQLRVKGRILPFPEAQRMVHDAEPRLVKAAYVFTALLPRICHKRATLRQRGTDDSGKTAKPLEPVMLRRAQHHPRSSFGRVSPCGNDNLLFRQLMLLTHHSPRLAESAEGAVHGTGGRVHADGRPHSRPVSGRFTGRFPGEPAEILLLRRTGRIGKQTKNVLSAGHLPVHGSFSNILHEQPLFFRAVSATIHGSKPCRKQKGEHPLRMVPASGQRIYPAVEAAPPQSRNAVFLPLRPLASVGRSLQHAAALHVAQHAVTSRHIRYLSTEKPRLTELLHKDVAVHGLFREKRQQHRLHETGKIAPRTGTGIQNIQGTSQNAFCGLRPETATIRPAPIVNKKIRSARTSGEKALQFRLRSVCTSLSLPRMSTLSSA